MAKKKKKKKQQGNSGNVYYGYVADGFRYDPGNCDCMPEQPVAIERKNFKKLGRDEKTVIRDFIVNAVTEYWKEKRQIPVGESLAAIKNTLVQLYLESCHVMLKDDTELKNYLRDHTLATINRLLKAERQAEQE